MNLQGEYGAATSQGRRINANPCRNYKCSVMMGMTYMKSSYEHDFTHLELLLASLERLLSTLHL
jgi:hypothetical protein